MGDKEFLTDGKKTSHHVDASTHRVAEDSFLSLTLLTQDVCTCRKLPFRKVKPTVVQGCLHITQGASSSVHFYQNLQGK